jgi:hypothetical protein
VYVQGEPGQRVVLLWTVELGVTQFVGLTLDVGAGSERCCDLILPGDGMGICEVEIPIIMSMEDELSLHLQAVGLEPIGKSQALTIHISQSGE